MLIWPNYMPLPSNHSYPSVPLAQVWSKLGFMHLAQVLQSFDVPTSHYYHCDPTGLTLLAVWCVVDMSVSWECLAKVETAVGSCWPSDCVLFPSSFIAFACCKQNCSNAYNSIHEKMCWAMLSSRFLNRSHCSSSLNVSFLFSCINFVITVETDQFGCC